MLCFRTVWLSCVMFRLRDFLKALPIPLVCLPLLLWLHLQPSANSMLNLKYEGYGPTQWGISQQYLADVVQYHQSEAAFARRPFTTQAVLAWQKLSGWSMATSWLLFQLAGWLAVALMLYFLAGGGAAAWWSQACFFAAFSVFFSWFPPVYTYDEPLQYALLLAALLAGQQGRVAWMMLLFGFSLWARETGWVLWPALAWMYGRHAEKRMVFWTFSAFWLVAYLVWWFVASAGHGNSPQPADEVLLRFTLLELNFAADRWGESVWTCILVLALPLLLSLKSGEQWPLAWRQVFWFSVALNSLLVFGTAFAREARLFALPLLLAWPYLGMALRSALLDWWQMGDRRWWMIPMAVLLAIWLPPTYVQSGANAAENYFHEYLAVYIGVVVLLLWAKLGSKPSALGQRQ